MWTFKTYKRSPQNDYLYRQFMALRVSFPWSWSEAYITTIVNKPQEDYTATQQQVRDEEHN